MRPTISIQQRPLLVGQITGSAAVNVGDADANGLDYIVGREDSKAARARQLNHHLHRLGGRHDSTRLPLVNVWSRGTSANFRKSGPTQRARPWTPRRLRDIFLPPRSNRWSSSSGPALNAPRSLLPTIPSSSCESVLLTSTADDPERSVLKSASCFSFSAGNTWSPSATYVPGDTVSPSLPTTSSVVKSTCVRNVVRTCLTAFAYISTPARCFLLKSSERLRWQDRQHKSW